MRRARTILAERGGVLISDSVGLGKTYIALALIEDALRAGKRVGVITPAALRRGWTVPLRELARTLGVRDTHGLGGGAPAATPSAPRSPHGVRTPRNSGSPVIPRSPYTSHTPHTPHTPHTTRTPLVAWTSHTRLARGTAPKGIYGGLDLIVVDEAHAFRNPRTLRYRALAVLARGARLVLITATPVNNSLADLHTLIRLFAGDGDFRDLGVPDLGAAIRAAASAERTGRAAPALEPVLRAIMIRRTREIVRRGEEAEGVVGLGKDPVAPSFPRRAPPTPIHYSLARLYPGFLPDLLATLSGLTLAPFRLGAYGAHDGESRFAPVELIRLGLLKRLESSLAAFRASIGRQLRYARAFLDSLDRGLLRVPADDRAFRGRGDAEGLQFALEELTLRASPPGLDLTRLRRDVERDHQRLRTLHRRLAAVGRGSDPKVARLREVLDDVVRGEKAVIFTEFRETARYLWRELRDRGGVALIDGGGARLGAGAAGRQEVIDRFAPLANHAPPPPPHERVDLLIATDVLAEGLNLQDARHVISYDLPWNPVRVIQRVGRVDRIASPHDVVYPYHFLPDEGLDELLHLMRRLQTKLAAIRRTVGAEGEVVADRVGVNREATDGAAAERASVGNNIRRRFDALEREEAMRAAYRRARDETEVGRRVRTTIGGDPATPPTALMAGPPGSEHLLLVACRVAREVVFLIQPARRGARAREDDAMAAEILLAALDHEPREPHSQIAADGSPPGPATSNAPDPALLRRGIRAARTVAMAQLAAIRGADQIRVNSPGARAARLLLAALAAPPGGVPDPALCRRADRLLPLLSRHHDAGTEARIRAVLGEGGEERPPEELILALEEALAGIRDGAAGKGAGSLSEGVTMSGDSFEIVGIIEYRPAPFQGFVRSSGHG